LRPGESYDLVSVDRESVMQYPYPVFLMNFLI